MKEKIETKEEAKKKKKLRKIQIVKIFMAGLSALCLIFAIVFTCLKTPIDGTIYRINTTQKERETIWEKKRDELFDY
jgi:flagellar basal body-associated protein FliL